VELIARAESAESSDGPARVCLASMRGTKKLAAWCSNYEFEDVISAVDEVDLVSMKPGPGFAAREWLVNRMVWRPGVRRIAARTNPGMQVETLKKEYDVFVFVCMNPGDLIYLNSLKGWRDCSKVKVCYMVEFYAGWLREYAFHLGLLRAFDHVMLCFEGSVAAVQDLVGKPVHHVPLGVDALRFTPFPRPPARVIDYYSMGRRSEVIHRALLDMATRDDAFYVYDTVPGMLIQPSNHVQHRNLVANLARRSKFFMAFPAKFDHEDETRGQSEVGARFFEGAAAGAVLLGRAPSATSFARDFGWPNAVVDAGTSEQQFRSAIASVKADPDLLDATSRRSAAEALRKFDWAYRWKEILRLIGIAPSPKLAQREGRMHELAASGGNGPGT
jgi:hypothetical protein